VKDAQRLSKPRPQQEGFSTHYHPSRSTREKCPFLRIVFTSAPAPHAASLETSNLYEPRLVPIGQGSEGWKQMKHHDDGSNVFGNSDSHKKHIFLFATASFAWFIFRTGTKPSRIVYPCQKAAIVNSSMLLGLTIPLWLASASNRTRKFASRRAISILTLLAIVGLLFSTGDFLENTALVGAANPNQELSLSLAPLRASNPSASNLYVANGREQAHVSNMITLMGANGLHFYESATAGTNQGPDGLIAKNDVVLIKINEEWPYRGGTNTDLLKELIQALINHPEGFIGEIIVADNGQWQGNMDWPQSNAEDHAQSTIDVVSLFSQASTYSWIPIRNRRVQEYSEGDLTDGYILNDTPDPQTGIRVSYPKFKTQFGTYVSFKEGIWNGTGYEKRLKVINMPVLKSHSNYGVTAALKHYMGVQSQGEGQAGLSNGHSSVANGGMGTLMAETRFPTLNIIDAIWINANPPGYSGAGPSTPYNMATRVNVILASTDPVAADYWVAKHVLMQTASLIGHTDTHSIDPDNTIRTGVSGEAFGVWLRRAEKEIADAGYSVTSDENKMNVYLSSEASTWCEIGVPYKAADNLTVTLNNFTFAERTSSYQYTIIYTLKNENLNQSIDEGTFKMYYKDTTGGQNQNGSLGTLSPNDTITKSYTFEELKTKAFDVLDYHPDQFSSSEPPADSLLWNIDPYVIPEFPSIIIPALLIMTAPLAIAVHRRRHFG
jgi:hypothetical protein